MTTVMVTGGAGFIGSNTALELVNRGYGVKMLDNLSTGSFENIATFKDDVDLIEGDIRDIKTVRKCMKDVEYVIHEAALPSVPRSIEDPLTSNDVNITGALN